MLFDAKIKSGTLGDSRFTIEAGTFADAVKAASDRIVNGRIEYIRPAKTQPPPKTPYERIDRSDRNGFYEAAKDEMVENGQTKCLEARPRRGRKRGGV